MIYQKLTQILLELKDCKKKLDKTNFYGVELHSAKVRDM